MYCNKCGNKINDNSAFCPNCGATLDTSKSADVTSKISSDISNNPKKTKLKIVLILFGSIIVVACILFFIFLFKSNNKYEGRGYNTKNDALKAYCNYFKKQDIDGMISCFAIESLSNNDINDNYWTNLNAFNPVSSKFIPIFGKFSNDFSNKNIYRRNLDEIYYQYLTLCAPEFCEGGLNFVSLSEYSDYDSMINDLYDYTNDAALFSMLNFENTYIDAKDIIGNDKIDNFNKMLSKYKDIYNAQDYDCLSTSFTFNGKRYLLCADLAKYNNKWYIFSFKGTLSSFLVIPVTNSGIVEYSEVFN